MSAVLNYSAAWWGLFRGHNLIDVPNSEARTARRSRVIEIDPFEGVIRQLDALLGIDNHNGFQLRTSAHANTKAHDYLRIVRAFQSLPKPEVTPDGEGGIDIEWEYNGRHLALSVRTVEAEPDFISWREPQGRYEGAPATEEVLNEKLEWLNTED